MANQSVEVQRAILILQLYLSFLENGADLNKEDMELAVVLGEHSVVKLALDTSPNKNDYLPL